MDRDFYLQLAAEHICMPIGTDLVLHEQPEAAKVRNDGAALGQVMEEAARRWNTPLAFSLMDLRLEKIDLLARAGIAGAGAEAFHFERPLDDAALEELCSRDADLWCPASRARDDALAYIAGIPDLVAVGMAIGPFSLVTRLMSDPIAAVAMAGLGRRTPVKCGCCGSASQSQRRPSPGRSAARLRMVQRQCSSASRRPARPSFRRGSSRRIERIREAGNGAEPAVETRAGRSWL